MITLPQVDKLVLVNSATGVYLTSFTQQLSSPRSCKYPRRRQWLGAPRAVIKATFPFSTTRSARRKSATHWLYTGYNGFAFCFWFGFFFSRWREKEKNKSKQEQYIAFFLVGSTNTINYTQAQIQTAACQMPLNLTDSGKKKN